MILKYSIVAAVILAAIVAAIRWLPRASPEKTAAAVAERVLNAVARQDYDAFIAEADKSVRKMRVEHFRSLAESQASKLRAGHTLSLIDERWRGAVHVSRWKLTFKDGSRDATLTLGVREGKVATFAIF